jgi:hypothetical protein
MVDLKIKGGVNSQYIEGDLDEEGCAWVEIDGSINKCDAVKIVKHLTELFELSNGSAD